MNVAEHVYVEARKKAILADYVAGVKIDEIARRHGVHRSYAAKLAARHGLERRGVKANRFWDAA